MTSDRSLGVWQVAAMLVSASYGIGFLFGSGELALQHGMAGSIYGVATAAGMFILAAGAQRLWAAGVPIWEWFGRAYGPGASRAVALLSLVWMAGVLAAQIHGGTAVALLLGLRSAEAFWSMLFLVFFASRLNLQMASTVFAACLLSSAVVLVYALTVSGGWAIYFEAWPAFSRDITTFSLPTLSAMTMAVALLVCTGADYHQFVLAARSASAAWLGCTVAGALLIVVAFLPAALVVALQQAGETGGLADSRQVIPFLLAKVAQTLAPAAGTALLIALSTAALGSGAAILRAMSLAIESVAPSTVHHRFPVSTLVALALGAGLASRDQGIIETMVSVNVVYVSSIAVCVAALAVRRSPGPAQACAWMAIGFVASTAVYVASWVGGMGGNADALALLAGTGASVTAAVSMALMPSRTRRRLDTGG